MYIAEFAATAWSGGNGGSGNPDGEWDQEQPAPVCWCNQTLRELGPDGEPAELASCSNTVRECYRRPVGLL